jgi:enoyl-[acyl-carrier-protein] reductase (NADH)
MMMGITAWAKEEKAKRAAWRDNNELKKRIEELEIQLKQTLDNSISQSSALRDRMENLEKTIIDVLIHSVDMGSCYEVNLAQFEALKDQL